MGKLIVLEGLDGSGKATQAGLLYDALQGRGNQVKKVAFPDYASDSSALIKMYLSGAFGSDAEQVNAYAASTFYSVDRYASYKSGWGAFYEKGGIVVADRYTTSNAVHQCSKLPQQEWKSFLMWLFDLEYEKIAIPRPDLVLYLDVEPAVSQQLLAERYQGDEAKKDIHEKDLQYLQKSREAAEYCAQTLGWTRVQCTNGGRMRGIAEIHRDIVAYTETLCKI